ncbi:MAG TPA: hypothetical protein VLV76_22260 [Candidatus Acidoferrum sp.]|nr:hypothetical protein [Candidatus Acidoferrum sp.]
MSSTWFAEEPMQSADDLIQVIAGERIQNTLRPAARSHELGGAQLRQVLGERRLPEPREPLQFGNPPLAAEQLAEDEQAVLVAHGLQPFRRQPGRRARNLYIHSC